MTKFKEYVKKMYDENADEFAAFRTLHDNYQANSITQDEYNEAGKPIISLIRDYEDRLCRQSEGSGYAQYTGNLAEKFWGEIRQDFPLIDRVGVKITKVDVAKNDDFDIPKISTFHLKKISLGENK